MPPTTDPTSAIQDAFLASIKQGQELALQSAGAWSAWAGEAFSLPSFGPLPLANAVPQTREFVDAGFDFAAELLAVQKDFYGKLIDTVAPKNTK
jgi:hypothetical protein